MPHKKKVRYIGHIFAIKTSKNILTNNWVDLNLVQFGQREIFKKRSLQGLTMVQTENFSQPYLSGAKGFCGWDSRRGEGLPIP